LELPPDRFIEFRVRLLLYHAKDECCWSGLAMPAAAPNGAHRRPNYLNQTGNLPRRDLERP